MKVVYDKYYKTENLFGEPYPELIDFFASYPEKGKVLDLGCGQGRDAIPIARLRFEVVGVDNSKVGIDQLARIAKSEKLNIRAQVADIYKFNDFEDIDFVIFDSMFHFLKKDREKETDLIKRTIKSVKPGCLIVICIQNTGNKVKILNETLDFEGKLQRIEDLAFKYEYNDEESGHKSITDYRMIVVRK